ncbi:MAG: ABC transporter permease, partial [Firmicutes bacterium]|nr:ABC transporter permease [Bacillota bacterium]
MQSFYAGCWAESLKIRRSKMLWITILAFMFIPAMMGALMYVIKNPDMAYKFGMIGTKAAMIRFGEADWSTYLGLLTQVVAGIGLLGFGFLASWIFGREYSDRTAKDLLALPVSRALIVLSKFLALFIWCVFLAFILFAAGLLVGGIIQLAGWSSQIFLNNAYTYFMTSLLTIFLCTPVAFFASYGRGYLPPLGFVILTLILAQFVGLVGLGPYFPWAIPLLYTGAAGAESAALGTISYLILFLTSCLGLVATI